MKSILEKKKSNSEKLLLSIKKLLPINPQLQEKNNSDQSTLLFYPILKIPDKFI
jgi:hypothetical protein